MTFGIDIFHNIEMIGIFFAFAWTQLEIQLWQSKIFWMKALEKQTESKFLTEKNTFGYMDFFKPSICNKIQSDFFIRFLKIVLKLRQI